MATHRSNRGTADDGEPRGDADFRTLADNIPDVVALYDRRLRHLYVNPAIERLTAIPRDAFPGRTNRELGFPERAVRVWERHLRRAFDTGRPDRFDIVFEARDGPRHVETRLVPEVDPDVGVASVVSITRDLTERNRLERSQRFLAKATGILSSSLDYEATLRRVADLAVPDIADWCVVYIDDGGRLESVALAHADPTKVADARRIEERYPRPDATVGVYHVLRTGEPQVWPEVTSEVLEAVAHDDEHLRILRSAGLRSAMTVPLNARGRTLGVISLITTDSEQADRRLDESDVPFVTALADRAAVAVDNARLFREVRAGEERAEFLAQSGAVLTASLDYATTLRALARLVVPGMADWCIVDVLEPGDGIEIRRVATEHADSTKVDALRELRSRYPPHWDSPQPAARAIRTGLPMVLQHVSDDDLVRSTHDARHARLIRAIGVQSVIAVPLIARGEALGALTLVSVSEDRTYGPDEQAVAQELARRAATAVDNARLYERALVAGRAKSDFLTVMSHELRTPLNAAMGYADLLAAGIGGSLTAAQEHQVDRLRSSMRRLLGLVDRVIDFSQAGAGGDAARSETFDLAGLIEEVVDFVRPRAVEKGLSVELDLPESPWRVVSDPDKVRTIVMSLVSNAEKFTHEGRMGVRVRREDDDVVIEVYDTGIGIDPEVRKRIFEPFSQAAPPTTRRVGGVGLGLAVARRMARRLDGEIAVESEPGRGSTFRVRLPVRWPNERVSDDYAGRSPSSSE